jgi:hypothetical protein
VKVYPQLSKFTHKGSKFTHKGSKFTHKGSKFTHKGSKFTHKGSKFTHRGQSSFLGIKFYPYGPTSPISYEKKFTSRGELAL